MFSKTGPVLVRIGIRERQKQDRPFLKPIRPVGKVVLDAPAVQIGMYMRCRNVTGAQKKICEQRRLIEAGFSKHKSRCRRGI